MTEVYVADVSCLNDRLLFRDGYDKVRQERKEKIDLFRFPKDKYLSLGGELLLLYGLKLRGITDPQIGTDSYGKPCLCGNAAYFNISHSGCMAVCALSDSPIGCDIQQMRKVQPIQHHLHPRECAFIAEGADENEKTERFFRIWTMKESYIKAVGLGLQMPLDGFCLLPGEKTAYYDADTLYIHEFDGFSDYRLCICGADPSVGTAALTDVDLCHWRKDDE